MLKLLSTFARSPRAHLCLALALAASIAAHAQTKNATTEAGAASQKTTAARKSAPATPAQQDAANAKADEKSSGSPATRARRVGEQSASGGDAKGVEKAAADAKKEEKKPAADKEEKKPGAEKSATAAKAEATKGEAAKPETVEAELSRRRAEIASASPDERARLRRALVDRLVELDRKGEALEELRLMIHEDRFDPVFFYNTGNALARLGDANAAADAYRKAVAQRKGNYARALNNLGVVLTRQGRWDEAFDALAAALNQENYTYAEASYNLGRLYLLRGEANLAIREWTRTLRLDPDHAEAAAALARAYAEDGNEKRGLAVLSSFTARSSVTGGGVPREIAAAREEINAGMEPATPRDGSEAANTGAGGAASPVSANANGVAAPSSPNSPRALPASRASSARGRSFEVDPQTYDLLQSARSANEGGKYEEAVRRYRDVLARSRGYFPPANLELGLALINLKRDEEAASVLTALTERDGARYPVAHYHLARLYERRGQLELAASHFARAAELYGDAAPQMMFDLSRLREKLNDPQGALSAMESYVASISRQGSVPDWAAERVNALREKAKAAPTPQADAKPKP